MTARSDSTYIDLTRAVQEFGFGPSDDSEESDSDGEEAKDWDSIGLLPSWQKLQITLRNASYSFIAGLKKEADDTQSVHTNIKESPEEVTGDILDKNHEESRSLNEKDPAYGISDTKKEIEKNGEDLKEYQSERGFSEEENEGDDEREEEDEDEEEDEEDPEEDDADEWEEIGRLPTFNQLQSTLKNASEIFTLPPTVFGRTESPLPTIRSPSDLLAKWGGPTNSGKIGWQTFMQNFQFPSFLAEERSDEEEPLDLNDPQTALLCSDEGVTAEDRQIGYNYEGLTGCAHYLRNCKSECSKCHRFYMCQLCHDEEDQSHQMDRRKTPRMLCLNCHKTQPPRRKCFFCKEVMGDYYCGECKLWNDDPDRPIYHCDKCGICRVGRGIGIDVFHCDTCAICMNLCVQDNHKCIEQAAKSNCPICLDDLFASTRPTVFMPCGHPIHRECFTEYSKRYYRCPICSKSILNTSALFRMIDEEVQCEVLPPELANKTVNIICQDCRLKSRTNYHLAGLKCETCGSYNTARL